MRAIRRGAPEAGFSLIELMVVVFLFSVAVVAMYQLMFAQVRGSEDSRDTAEISQEARLGLNRMVRDTREAATVSTGDGCDTTALNQGRCYSIRVDFNGDGNYDNPNPDGDYEALTFAFDPSSDTITLIACDGGCLEEPLVENVGPIGSRPVFSFSSNVLKYDSDQDGVTEWDELDSAPTVGNSNNRLDAAELDFISNVSFALLVSGEQSNSDFFAEAQLRNRRYGSE